MQIPPAENAGKLAESPGIPRNSRRSAWRSPGVRAVDGSEAVHLSPLADSVYLPLWKRLPACVCHCQLSKQQNLRRQCCVKVFHVQHRRRIRGLLRLSARRGCRGFQFHRRQALPAKSDAGCPVNTGRNDFRQTFSAGAPALSRRWTAWKPSTRVH